MKSLGKYLKAGGTKLEHTFGRKSTLACPLGSNLPPCEHPETHRDCPRVPRPLLSAFEGQLSHRLIRKFSQDSYFLSSPRKLALLSLLFAFIILPTAKIRPRFSFAPHSRTWHWSVCDKLATSENVFWGKSREARVLPGSRLYGSARLAFSACYQYWKGRWVHPQESGAGSRCGSFLKHIT